MLTPAVGYFASAMSIGMFIPQLVQSWKTKQTDGISTFSFMLVALQNVSWMSYGLLLWSIPLIFTNAVVLLLATTILCVKWKLASSSHGRQSHHPLVDHCQTPSSTAWRDPSVFIKISHARFSAAFSSSVT